MAQKEQGKSDMNGWTDGIAYTDLTIVKNAYFNSGGHPASYNGWDRTGYVPCEGASSITFPPATGATAADLNQWSHWFDSAKQSLGKIVLSATTTKTISVPANAKYFGLSTKSSSLTAVINGGIVPHA